MKDSQSMPFIFITSIKTFGEKNSKNIQMDVKLSSQPEPTYQKSIQVNHQQTNDPPT
jgi:hypothetical protein